MTTTAAQRIWLGPAAPDQQTRLFRRTFTLDAAPSSATLRVFGDLRYHVWINGTYVGRGPVFHHPHKLILDPYDVAPLLKPGKNVIAALVHTPNTGIHNAVPTAAPGLIAELTWTTADGKRGELVTDASWRATDQTGWTTQSPKRCWALAYIEVFDTAEAPAEWQQPDFDDSGWSPAEAKAPADGVPGAQILDRALPDLRYAFVAPTSLIRFEGITSPPAPLKPSDPSNALGNQLVEADWRESTANLKLTSDPIAGGFAVEGLTKDLGGAVHLDIGKFHVGQVVLELTSDSGGVIDVMWSEAMKDGRPQWVRKGVTYGDRIHAAPGNVSWRPIWFSGMRYLTLALRNFTGSVRITKFGVHASEPDLDWTSGAFESDDKTLDDIFAMCVYTLQAGTQEGLMDCPTREQAPYIGDGHPVAEWIARVTGDVRHWQYLVVEQFARQAKSGLIRSTPFSSRDDALIDYNILALVGTRDYYQYTQDTDTVRQVLPAARRVLDWFLTNRSADGFFNIDWEHMKQHGGWEYPFDPEAPHVEDINLFIDHPGMGWHNVGEAGIDRRGVNAGVNALIAVGCRALADLEDVAGDAARAATLRKQADDMATLVRDTFYDEAKGCFIDGVREGKKLPQVSQHTNAWAVWAEACGDDDARRILRELLESDDEEVAIAGPYFWRYIFPALDRLGMHDLAIKVTRKLWSPMLDSDTTTLWETFAGDEYDSWCHPWSGAALPMLLSSIAGLPDPVLGHASLRPRYDLLSKLEAAAHTAAGRWQIAWEKTGDTVKLHGVTPEGCEAQLVDIAGNAIKTVQGQWAHEIRA